MPPVLYDTIGIDYRNFRVPDARIAAQIDTSLEGMAAIVNVGAGSGSYEPRDRRVLAVEPSIEMILQRDATAAPVVRAVVEALPLADGSFDAALAILTVHHWSDQAAGLRELARVAKRRLVILSFLPDFCRFWLAENYLPELYELAAIGLPPVEFYEEVLGSRARVDAVPVPHDCTDGFLCAYWRRPRAYLDPRVRQAISVFSRMKNPEPGLERLRADLDSGRWNELHAELLEKDSLDLGYRLFTFDLQ